MRRIFGWLILLGLIAVGLLWPLVFRGGGGDDSPASDPVVFTDFDAEFTVRDDGTLDVVETITGEFPSGRHGIFQYWDIANPNDPRIRQTPELTSIRLDGEPVPYQMLWEQGERLRVAKIGDPDSTLWSGTHVYEIRYTVPGALIPVTAVVMWTRARWLVCVTFGSSTIVGVRFKWSMAGCGIVAPGSAPRTRVASLSPRQSRSMVENSPGLKRG